MKKVLMIPAFLSVSLFGFVSTTSAESTSNLRDVCKSECPKAKNNHQAHACLEKKKKNKTLPSDFENTDCAKAMKAHEASESDEHDHKH